MVGGPHSMKVGGPHSIEVGRRVATHAAATRSPLRAQVGNETDVPGALAVWRQNIYKKKKTMESTARAGR